MSTKNKYLFVYKALCLYKKKVCIQLVILKLEKSITAITFIKVECK